MIKPNVMKHAPMNPRIKPKTPKNSVVEKRWIVPTQSPHRKQKHEQNEWMTIVGGGPSLGHGCGGKAKQIMWPWKEQSQSKCWHRRKRWGNDWEDDVTKWVIVKSTIGCMSSNERIVENQGWGHMGKIQQLGSSHKLVRNSHSIL